MRIFRETTNKREEPQFELCSDCPLANMDSIDVRGPNHVSPAGETLGLQMWRRDWRKGESIDDHGYRGHISTWVGVTVEEAELIWNCALSQFKGQCEHDSPREDRIYTKGIGDIPL